MKKALLVIIVAVIACSLAYSGNISIGARAGYGSFGYNYWDKTLKTKENAGFSGFPIDVEFDYRFGESGFGAMAVVGLSLGRSFFADTLSNGETTNNMSSSGKVMFDSFFSIFYKFPVNEAFDVKVAFGPAIQVYEANKLVNPSKGEFTAMLLGAKIEGAISYDIGDFMFANAGLDLNFGLADTAKSNSSNAEVKKSAFSFGWDLFLGVGFGL